MISVNFCHFNSLVYAWLGVSRSRECIKKGTVPYKTRIGQESGQAGGKATFSLIDARISK